MAPVRVSALPTSAGTSGALQEPRWLWYAEKGAFLLPEIHHAHALRSAHFASASLLVHPGATTPECASLYVHEQRWKLCPPVSGGFGYFMEMLCIPMLVMFHPLLPCVPLSLQEG